MVGRGRLALLRFRGSIREATVEPYVRILRALRSRKRYRGVLLDISSGGGGDIPSTDLYLAVKRLDTVKPVVASIGSIGASGGYMAALGARKVFAYPDSAVGSIGVVYPHLAVGGLLTKLGIDVELLHEGRHKDAYQGLRALTDEERTKLQAVAHTSYQSFVSLVARERRKTAAEVESLATGEFWSGRDALALGLVDALGDREMALAELGQMTGVAPERAELLSPPRPFLERLINRGATGLSASLAEQIRGGLEELVWDGFRLGPP